MSNPFLTATTEVIGGFQLARHGNLLQGEEEWFEQRELRQIEHAIPVTQMAKRLVESQGVTPDKAFAALENLDPSDPEDQALLIEVADDLPALAPITREQQEFLPLVATLAIQSRVDPAWLEANAENLEQAYRIAFLTRADLGEELSQLTTARDAEAMENGGAINGDTQRRIDEIQTALSLGSPWLHSYTRRLSRSVVEQLVQFMSNERRRWQGVEGESEPIENADDLGKSSGSTKGFSPPAAVKATGKTATGKSSRPGSRTRSSTEATGTVALPA